MTKDVKPDWRPGEYFETATKNYILRSLEPGDVDQEYLNWWNDPETMRSFGTRPRNWTLAKARKHVSKFNNKTTFHLGIFDKKTGKKIGFYATTIDPKNKISTTNLCIGNSAFRSMGVATELSSHMVPLRFQYMDVEKIETKVKGNNPASMALHKALGFTLEGVLRKHYPLADGSRGDIYLFGLLKSEWRGSQKK